MFVVEKYYYVRTVASVNVNTLYHTYNVEKASRSDLYVPSVNPIILN